MVAWLIDVVLHLDRHLLELLTRYELWIYPILFAVIFAETGLVVTPFLPGDSLLFAVGTLAAVDRSGVLQGAARERDTRSRGGARQHRELRHRARHRSPGLQRPLPPAQGAVPQTHREFFRRHGAMAILLSRFVPIIRTCAPFVAGVGRMPYARFLRVQLRRGFRLGAAVRLGRLPVRQHWRFVREHFGVVTLLIIAASLVRWRAPCGGRPAAR